MYVLGATASCERQLGGLFIVATSGRAVRLAPNLPHDFFAKPISSPFPPQVKIAPTMVSTKSLANAAALLLCMAASPAFSQIQFKLQWMPDSLAWGVFAKPEQGIEPSEYLIIGSGQVTLVAPAGSMFGNLKSFSGTWEQNATVNMPKENPEMDYISFGLVTADPPMPFRAGEETLLFTFANRTDDCPDKLSLIANDDPFNVFHNSANSNPGNDITVLDPGNDKTIYYFTNVYAADAWDCKASSASVQGPFIHGYDKRRFRRINRP
jgi:hypothetical protein